MGVECCRIKTEVDLNAQKIICLKVNGNHCYIHIFNCENEISNEIEINPQLVKMDGVAQISINNVLYLIGGTNDNPVKETSRSQCMNINTAPSPIDVNFELASKYYHYYPTLCLGKKDSIYVIGGKDSVKCEEFFASKRVWNELPDLPSERYGCSAICLGAKHLPMIFGGMNTKTGELSNEILQLSLAKCAWISIGKLGNQSIRYWSGSIIYKDSIILFGGYDKENKLTDYISTIDLNDYSSSIVVPQVNLSKPSKFQHLFSFGYHSGMFYLFDEDDFQIHKILINEKKCELFSFYHAGEIVY